jgi:endogenous inhibitor of DNA gyrase (YacG/DUF329 family)
MTNDRCPRCRRLLVEITIESGEHPMTMRSCSHCDVREWTSTAGPVALDGVLDDLTRER